MRGGGSGVVGCGIVLMLGGSVVGEAKGIEEIELEELGDTWVLLWVMRGELMT